MADTITVMLITTYHQCGNFSSWNVEREIIQDCNSGPSWIGEANILKFDMANCVGGLLP